VKVVPTASALYVLTALNERGAKATAFVSVKVSGADADALLFAAFPETLAPTEAGTLLWTAPNARTVTITDAAGTALDLQGQVESGSVPINPTTASATYTLTADGQVRTVTVTRAPAIDALTVSTPSAPQGDPVVVRWSTTWATKVTLSSPGVGVLLESSNSADVAMGSFSGLVPALPDGAVVHYVLAAEGPGGTVRRDVSLVAGTNPAVTEVTAPKYAKIGGTFTLSWKTANADQVQVLTGGLVVYETITVADVQNGSVRLATPATMSTFTVRAVSVRSGRSASKDVTVDAVGDTTIDTFTVTPGAVATGGSPVTLTWNVPNARRVRVEQDDALTVVWIEGPAAQSGTATAYPNSPITHFRLTADNQLDAPVTASADATVGTPAELTSADGGLVFQGIGTSADIVSPVGTELHGLPLNTFEAVTPSTGFIDISATGTKLAFTNQDTGYATFTVPGFETFLYGNRLGTGTLTASPNGFLSLRLNTLNVSPPTVFPTTNTTYNNVLAPFYANLELGPVGNVYWEVRGNAPNRTLIVQWEKVRVTFYPYSELTFQLQLTQAGVVTYEYKTLNGLPAAYSLAIGLQTTAGRGINYGQIPSAPTRVRFFGATPSPATVPTSRVPVSGFAKIGTGFAPISLARFLRTGDLSLSEVMYATAAGVPSGEWIEVRNASTSPVNLNGWQLDFGGGNIHTISGNATVPAGGVLVLGQTTDPMLNDGVTVNYAYGTSFVMNDLVGSVTLRNPNFGTSATWTAAGPGGSGIAGVFDQTPIITPSTSSVLGPVPCAATQLYGSQAPRQRGTPGTITSCHGYLLQPIKGAFEDISSPATYVTLTPVSVTSQPSEEGLAQVDVSAAPITLFGTPTNTLTVSTNGWLYPFAWTSSNAGSNNKTRPDTAVPASGQIIAPFWDDLEWIGRTDAGVYAKRYAAGQSAVDPRAHWIIEWKNLSRWWLPTNNDFLNFEVKFFDSGDVEYHYGAMLSGTEQDYAGGTSATVWLENPAGTEALTWSINSAAIGPNTGLRYLRAP
jgi:hypothetical protein